MLMGGAVVQDFKNLETFVAVATLGSFRAAAERLHTTQPAVSQRIAQLEHQYGTRLLERTSRVVTTTEKGREFLAFAERILRLGTEMRDALVDGSALRGTLRLGVAETIVHTWLPGFIGAVARQHPGIAVEIEVDTSPQLRERLLDQEIDLAFLLGPLADPLVQNLPLNRVALAFLASPDFPLPPAPLGIAALAGLPLITFARHTQPHAALRTLMTRSDLPPPRIHASAALAPVVRLAVEGVGIAMIPPAVAARELDSGALVSVATEVALPDLVFTASWLGGHEAGLARAVATMASAAAAAASAP
jgi:DNA-binding transcriptional LysR family regulator